MVLAGNIDHSMDSEVPILAANSSSTDQANNLDKDLRHHTILSEDVNCLIESETSSGSSSSPGRGSIVSASERSASSGELQGD